MRLRTRLVTVTLGYVYTRLHGYCAILRVTVVGYRITGATVAGYVYGWTLRSPPRCSRFCGLLPAHTLYVWLVTLLRLLPRCYVLRCRTRVRFVALRLLYVYALPVWLRLHTGSVHTRYHITPRTHRVHTFPILLDYTRVYGWVVVGYGYAHYVGFVHVVGLIYVYVARSYTLRSVTLPFSSLFPLVWFTVLTRFCRLRWTFTVRYGYVCSGCCCCYLRCWLPTITLIYYRYTLRLLRLRLHTFTLPLLVCVARCRLVHVRLVDLVTVVALPRILRLHFVVTLRCVTTLRCRCCCVRYVTLPAFTGVRCALPRLRCLVDSVTVTFTHVYVTLRCLRYTRLHVCLRYLVTFVRSHDLHTVHFVVDLLISFCCSLRWRCCCPTPRFRLRLLRLITLPLYGYVAVGYVLLPCVWLLLLLLLRWLFYVVVAFTVAFPLLICCYVALYYRLPVCGLPFTLLLRIAYRSCPVALHIPRYVWLLPVVCGYVTGYFGYGSVALRSRTRVTLPVAVAFTFGCGLFCARLAVTCWQFTRTFTFTLLRLLPFCWLRCVTLFRCCWLYRLLLVTFVTVVLPVRCYVVDSRVPTLRSRSFCDLPLHTGSFTFTLRVDFRLRLPRVHLLPRLHTRLRYVYAFTLHGYVHRYVRLPVTHVAGSRCFIRYPARSRLRRVTRTRCGCTQPTFTHVVGYLRSRLPVCSAVTHVCLHTALRFSWCRSLHGCTRLHATAPGLVTYRLVG